MYLNAAYMTIYIDLYSLYDWFKWFPELGKFSVLFSVLSIFSEVRCEITTQVEKSKKKITIVNFTECDLNQIFWIFVDSWMW